MEHVARETLAPPCAGCGAANLRWPQRRCHACHAASARAWRATHTLTDEQRRRDNARSYAGVYLRRGKLARGPCERCGGPGEHMHHVDYSRPLDVTWLCRPCHLAEHGRRSRL